MSRQRRSLLDEWAEMSSIKKAVVVGFAIFGVFILLVSIVSPRVDRTAPTPNQPPARAGSTRASSELKASVRFNGTQFVITNDDAFDWSNVKLEINGGIISGGYQLVSASMKSGETYTVGAMQFADSDGNRFNPFQMKPQKFRITASTPNGSGYYVGGWE